MKKLHNKTCKPCQDKTTTLTLAQCDTLLNELNDWSYSKEKKTITKTFKFKNYYQTIAFVNAIAWIANQAGHHPDLEVSYNRCIVYLTTHSIQQLSENDFICAAKIDKLS